MPFLFLVVYFSRGTLPKKRVKWTTGGPSFGFLLKTKQRKHKQKTKFPADWIRPQSVSIIGDPAEPLLPCTASPLGGCFPLVSRQSLGTLWAQTRQSPPRLTLEGEQTFNV